MYKVGSKDSGGYWLIPVGSEWAEEWAIMDRLDPVAEIRALRSSIVELEARVAELKGVIRDYLERYDVMEPFGDHRTLALCALRSAMRTALGEEDR